MFTIHTGATVIPFLAIAPLPIGVQINIINGSHRRGKSIQSISIFFGEWVLKHGMVESRSGGSLIPVCPEMIQRNDDDDQGHQGQQGGDQQVDQWTSLLHLFAGLLSSSNAIILWHSHLLMNAAQVSRTRHAEPRHEETEDFRGNLGQYIQSVPAQLQGNWDPRYSAAMSMMTQVSGLSFAFWRGYDPVSTVHTPGTPSRDPKKPFGRKCYETRAAASTNKLGSGTSLAIVLLLTQISQDSRNIKLGSTRFQH